MLFGCIYITDFHVQASLRGCADGPTTEDRIAIVDGPDSLLKVFACNQAARIAGAKVGMTKRQAEVCPGIVIRRRVLELEEAANAALLNCSRDFSSVVELTCPGTVIFNLTGTERLLGKPKDLGRKIIGRAAQAGFSVNVAIAADPDTALFAARGMAGMTVVPSGREAERLARLPITVLQAPPEIENTLENWGIRDFKSLAALPPVDVAVRLGQYGVHLQRLTRGDVKRELVPTGPLLSIKEEMELEEAIELLEPLGLALDRLLELVTAKLNARSLATDHLQIDLTLESHPDHQLNGPVPVASAPLHPKRLKLPVPTQDPKVLLRLVQLDYERNPPPGPVKKIAIEAWPARIRTTQAGLFQPLAPEPAKFEITLARLRAIVGDKDEQGRELVGSPIVDDSHRSDSFQLLSFSPGPQSKTKPAQSCSREFRVLRPHRMATVKLANNAPNVIVFGGMKPKILHASGIWHSSGNWWSTERHWQRDEWDLELSFPEGVGLYRVFRDLTSGEWFVAGMYD